MIGEINPAAVRTGWDVIEDACIARMTGELTLTTSAPFDTRVYLTNGLVYFAEHDGDDAVTSRLVSVGAIDTEQLQRGSVRLNGTDHLGRLFERDATIDRDAVELAVEMITERTLTEVADQPVISFRRAIYRQHPTGIAGWFATIASTTEEDHATRRPPDDAPAVSELSLDKFALWPVYAEPSLDTAPVGATTPDSATEPEPARTVVTGVPTVPVPVVLSLPAVVVVPMPEPDPEPEPDIVATTASQQHDPIARATAITSKLTEHERRAAPTLAPPWGPLAPMSAAATSPPADTASVDPLDVLISLRPLYNGKSPTATAVHTSPAPETGEVTAAVTTIDMGPIPVPGDVTAAVKRAIAAMEAATIAAATVAPDTSVRTAQPAVMEFAERNDAAYGSYGIHDNGMRGLIELVPAVPRQSQALASSATSTTVARRGALRRLIDGIRGRG